ncbi:MAG: DUF3109 family protein [Bacteroidota bacterium]|nr:DUF3109 family protein [Bacteroidota bacterium]
MIAIDNILVSDQVVQEQFVCDLTKCKGGCCEDGDAGAPLENDELDHLTNVYNEVKRYMTAEGVRQIEKQGKYLYDREFGWVTPTVNSQICAYGYKDRQGIVKCAIEQAYNDGKISWKKPISCHLFPIRLSKSKNGKTEFVNYEPREELCAAACKLGKKLKVPTYVFLKEAIIRKYGEEFYDTLDATAKHMEETK